MKKNMISTVMCVVAFATFLTACDDSLETKNFTDMSPSNFFNTEGDFDAAVTGLYLPLTTNWGYSDGGTGKWYNSLFNADINSYFAAGMVTTDIMRHYSSYVYDEFNVGPSTGGAITTTYNVLRFVARATDVISQMENSNGATENIRARYIAEAKTLRAFYMYTLLDFFGPLNVKLDPAKLMDNTIEPRPSHETYIGYIEKDLDDALSTAAFPDKYNDNPDEWGRMSKSIAYGIKLRLYMHEKNWNKAKEVAQNSWVWGIRCLTTMRMFLQLP